VCRCQPQRLADVHEAHAHLEHPPER
jgi:hypothetical protein